MLFLQRYKGFSIPADGDVLCKPSYTLQSHTYTTFVQMKGDSRQHLVSYPADVNIIMFCIAFFIV